MPDIEDRAVFIITLASDFMTARQRVEENDNPTHRRELIRTVAAGIEGMHWNLKDLVWRSAAEKLSVYEQAALLEETYNIDDKGNVYTQRRCLPLFTAFRLVLKILQRIRPLYRMDQSYGGDQESWRHLKQTVEVRNRLVHPKGTDDLMVTDQEVEVAKKTFVWCMAFNCEVMNELKEYAGENLKQAQQWLERMEQR